MGDRNRWGASGQGSNLYLDRDDSKLKIGSTDAIVDLLGGETYAFEYTDRQAGVSWLATGDNRPITINVRNELVEWEYTEEFVENVEKCPLNETGESGYSRRLEMFVELATTIWARKGIWIHRFGRQSLKESVSSFRPRQ